ncbi:MAG: Hsp20/alpha crystallin family protein [Spirochaetaceae bacterium]|jgi:HSP20 family molecular chaperone IbpA|nr:Hsp20/alpha crystallin family protein [Spirochaetaceae bacterium]
MKPRTYLDLGTIFDELFNVADEFRSELHKSFDEFSGGGCAGRDERPGRYFNGNTDYYPGFSYPPMNVFLTGDKSLIFEFALAGFDEKNIDLSFQGDYMIFSARIENERAEQETPEHTHYLKRRLKFKDIDMQKYYVPLDKYAQENVKAVFKNGILRVTIPPKQEPDQNDGVKIEIFTEGK